MKTGLLVLPSIPSTKDPPSASWGGGGGRVTGARGALHLSPALPPAQTGLGALEPAGLRRGLSWGS